MQKVDAVEEAFNDFLVRHEEKGTRFNSLEKSLTSLLSEGQAESQDVVLQQFVSVISTVSNSVHSKLLFGLLENLVSNNIVNSRYFCMKQLIELVYNKFIIGLFLQESV